jgi:hypothetical protein
MLASQLQHQIHSILFNFAAGWLAINTDNAFWLQVGVERYVMLFSLIMEL